MGVSTLDAHQIIAYHLKGTPLDRWGRSRRIMLTEKEIIDK